MYCNKCGQMIPDGSVFCNSCGTKQVQPTSAHATPSKVKPVLQEKKETSTFPAYYLSLSWLTFAIILMIGIVKLANNNSNVSAYKGIITCLSAFIFIPQITAGDKEKPLVVYAFKWIVAALVIFLL